MAIAPTPPAAQFVSRHLLAEAVQLLDLHAGQSGSARGFPCGQANLDLVDTALTPRNNRFVQSSNNSENEAPILADAGFHFAARCIEDNSIGVFQNLEKNNAHTYKDDPKNQEEYPS